MTLRPDLLERARQTQGDLARADRAALLARAEYHTAVRRLHLAGASLREIADAIPLSHQRVQQIVRGAGGSWWRTAWRTRRTTRDAICTWCGRPPSEVQKLVAGPKIYICETCVDAAATSLAELERSDSRRKLARSRCSFCSRVATAERPVVPGPHANVCGECLSLCREFMKSPEDRTR